MSAYDHVRADPSLAEEICEFFEVDCSTELSNAGEWVVDSRGVLIGGRERNRWLVALPQLATDGILDRDRLLDASLDALLRDFRPSMVSWYAKLHEELAPTQEERRARVDRYLSLLASPVPAVVKEGIVGLKALTGLVSAEELARAAIGPLSQKQKNLAVDMLALLGQAAKRDPEARAALLEGAVIALGHERADVQERALALLERYPDQAPRAGLLAYVDAVSPMLGPRVKRASEGNQWGWFTGVGLVQAVALSWTSGAGASARGAGLDSILGFLAHRAAEVGSRAARKNPRPLLAMPTHSGGRLDPDVLHERERNAGRLRNRPDSSDQLQARLRAHCEVTPIEYSRSVVGRGRWNQEVRLLELTPTSVPDHLGPLRSAVGGIGRTHGGSIWPDSRAWGSWDALGARWCLTLLPGHPEVAFAGAARLIVDQLETNPILQPQVVLEHALSSHVPLRPLAWLAVTGGLEAKSPDLQRVATDVMIASVDDGRFEADAAADALGWLFANGFAKASRLQVPLRDVGRVSQRHAVGVLNLTEALLERLTEAPHGLHAPLEAVLEHAARDGLEVKRPKARATLERIGAEVSRSSKLGRTVRSLLELPST